MVIDLNVNVMYQIEELIQCFIINILIELSWISIDQIDIILINELNWTWLIPMYLIDD